MKDKITSVKTGMLKIKEMWKNPRYRGIIMLGLYFIFFLFIIMGIRSGNTSTHNSSKNTTSALDYSLEKIKGNNYHYRYEVNWNDKKVVYEGDRYYHKELFTKNDGITEKFYHYNETYLKDVNNVWSKTENPYLFSDFKEISTVEEILKSASYDSKTEYSNQSMNYTYKVSTTTIEKVIEKKNIDIADTPNTISLTTNESKEVVKIEMDLTPYIYYKDNTNQQLKIILDYSKFGEIEEIKDPE